MLVVDIQERLLPPIAPSAVSTLLRGTNMLIACAREFEWPVFYSEQYPKGLGTTEPTVLEGLREVGAVRVEKTEFSCCRNPLFQEAVLPKLPSHVVVCGIEAHVCVLQTVADLQARGHQAFVPMDAVASRSELTTANGLALMRDVGVVVTNTESVMFHAAQRSGTDPFKRLQALIK